ncbi:MAG: DUF3536 domain-containing protein [Rhodobacterales bacterium]|nr:DUF3536 domain-containing protein [Rhodobacterales bacterium]
MSAVCIHGHFYQPTRENPWTGDWDAQPSAAPFRDWNTRIAAECYAPNAAARLLDPLGRTRKVVNNYASLSFDIGPTLITWLEANRPVVMQAIVQADRDSVRQFGHGAAIAQPFHHAILPLCSPEDRKLEIEMGLAVFERVFGRPTEGIWLPEAAVDTPTLEDCAALGVGFVVLAPRQVEAPTGEAYWVSLPSGAKIAVIPYGQEVSAGVAFGGWLEDGGAFADQLARVADRDGLALVATDGESYGHHHPFGEMALAYAVERLGDRLTNVASWFAQNPPTKETRIIENSSWSCAHGIERWRSACGCATREDADLRWRGPYREALNNLRAHALPHADDETRRHLLAMFTSCAWFFDTVTGVEPLQNLRHAACAIGLVREQTGIDLAPHFLADLARIPTEHPQTLAQTVHAYLHRPKHLEIPAHARRAGVLLPVSALGDLDGAIAFIDWLASAGMCLWQVLPLGPTDGYNCPYSSWSALSGNPELSGTEVAYVEQPAPWADDASLFACIKADQQGAAWWQWPAGLRDRDEQALAAVAVRLSKPISAHRYRLLQFEAQWTKVRRYAASRGVQIIGDVPIYVGGDSVDAWVNPGLFNRDCVAGAPPDDFSESGQWWGNPVFNWEAMAADGYRWWIERLRRGLDHCDVLRLDHFIGFSRYWSIPADAEDASWGTWQPGPGRGLFDALTQALGPLPLIVEDLGDVNDETLKLRDELGFPGMVVTQFGMEHRECAVVYPGTHDNDTIRGSLGDVPDSAVWRAMDEALESPARWAVFQMPDLLLLGSEARMNTPGTVGPKNWSWQLPAAALSSDLAAELRGRLEAVGRLRPQAHRSGAT